MLQKADSKIYIMGAGFAGQMIAKDLIRKKVFGTVAAFLDDDKSLIGSTIEGIPVLGPSLMLQNFFDAVLWMKQ